MSHIDFAASQNQPDEALAARQSDVVTTIESMLSAGLLVIGDVVGGTEEYVEPWKLSQDDALSRLRELYVTHYDDEVGWSWRIWFALTPEGERAASEIV